MTGGATCPANGAPALTTHHQLTIGRHTIHAAVYGDGPPLLLNGGAFSAMGEWGPLLEHLPGYQVITYDPPGVGASPAPAWPMTMPALARVAAGVLDQLGIESAHVLGVSFGGAVAQQLAADHPHRVSRLVLASTSFGGLALPGHPAALLGLAARADLAGLTRIRATVFRMSALMGWTSAHWLHRITHPALILCGSDDQVTPLVNHRVIATLIPAARLHVIPGEGHMMLLDAPAAAGAAITRFLADTPAETAEAA
jgi:poly(3-hydroxyoctanoate) depolymerase